MNSKYQLSAISYFAILLTLFLGVYQPAQATLFHTISDGLWSANSTWSPYAPPKTLQMNDKVTINHDVTFNSNGNHTILGILQINGSLDRNGFTPHIYLMGQMNISSTGLLNTDGIFVASSATLINNGDLYLNSGLHNEGMISNSGYLFGNAFPYSINNTGYALNSGQIELIGGLHNGGFLDNAISGTIKSMSNFYGTIGSAFSNLGYISIGRNFYTNGAQTGCGKLTVCVNFYAGKAATWASCQEVCAGGKRTDYTKMVNWTCSQSLAQQCPVIVTPPNFNSTSGKKGSDFESSPLSMDVYPNPCSGSNLNIKIENMKKAGMVSLLDLQGKTLYKQPVDPASSFSSEISLPNDLNSGMYIINFESSLEKISRKVLMQ